MLFSRKCIVYFAIFYRMPQERIASSIDDATRADQTILPIGQLKALRTHALSRAGTMDKLAAARIQARMQAARSLSVFEHENISRLQSFLWSDKSARPSLIRCNAGNGYPLLAIGPLDKTRTIKALAGSISTSPVARSDL